MSDGYVVMLNEQELRDVTMVAFAEQLLVMVADRTKPKSRRHNQLKAAIDRLGKIDETYQGAFQEDFQETALAALEKVETVLLDFFGGKGISGDDYEA